MGVSTKATSEWQETEQFNRRATNTTLGHENRQQSQRTNQTRLSIELLTGDTTPPPSPFLSLSFALSLSRPKPSLSDENPPQFFIPPSRLNHRLIW